MSNPENDTPVKEKSWVDPVIKIMGVLLILGGLPFLFLVSPVVGMMRRTADWTEAPSLLLFIVVLIAMPAALAGGVGLMSRAGWSRRLAQVATLVPALAGLLNLATDPSWVLVIMALIVGGPGLVIFAGLSVKDVRMAFEGDESLGTSLKATARVVVLLVIGIVVIGLTLLQLPDIVQELRMSRWESQCEETGETSPCGKYGQGLIRWSDSNEDRKTGLEIIKNLCDKGDSFSCRRYGYFMSYIDTSRLKASQMKILGDVEAIASKRCLEGDGRGCFISKLRFEWPTDILDNRTELLTRSVELCREGDIWACRAVYRFGVVESEKIQAVDADDYRYAVEKLCDDGFVVACATLDESDEEDQAKLREICRERPAMSACAILAEKLGDSAFELRRRFCLEGGLGSCSIAADGVPEEEPYRDVVVALYKAMGELSGPKNTTLHSDLGFWKVEPVDFEVATLETACDEEVPEACFALGISVSGDRRRDLVPDLGKLADYDRTFMRACRLGMNTGCFAYAERIMNRPIGERRRVDLANEAFEIACERGNEIACWYIDIDDDLIKGVPKDYEELLMRGCRAQDRVQTRRGACRELAYYWAHEFGATPWLFSERRTRALVRKHCAGPAGKWSCSYLAWMRRRPTRPLITSASPPWHIENFTAARKACKRRNLSTCDQMFEIAHDYPAVDESTVEELKAGVCEVLPDVDACKEDE